MSPSRCVGVAVHAASAPKLGCVRAAIALRLRRTCTAWSLRRCRVCAATAPRLRRDSTAADCRRDSTAADCSLDSASSPRASLPLRRAARLLLRCRSLGAAARCGCAAAVPLHGIYRDLGASVPRLRRGAAAAAVRDVYRVVEASMPRRRLCPCANLWCAYHRGVGGCSQVRSGCTTVRRRRLRRRFLSASTRDATPVQRRFLAASPAIRQPCYRLHHYVRGLPVVGAGAASLS